MVDERPRLTFAVDSFEFRDAFREAFPRGQADSVMTPILKEIVELSEDPNGRIIIAALMTGRISLITALKEEYNAYTRRTVDRI